MGAPKPDTGSAARALEAFERLMDADADARAAGVRDLAARDRDAAELLERMWRADGDEGAARLEPAHFAVLLDGEVAEEGADQGLEVGNWRLLRELGRGGMGTVWLAERADGQYQQLAALKLVKRGMDSDAIKARFVEERQILARLQHPNIARLFDGGVAADGRPYFALEHVEGVPLMEFARRHGLDLRARLEIFLKLCDAVAHAHSQLVVHRDLKPSNILVQADGEPRLLDFGIAKVIAGPGAEDTATAQAQRFLTPAYAAPEQLAGEPVTTATDAYALGLVLHELLSGTRRSTQGGATTRQDRPSVARVRAGAEGPARIRPQQLAGDLDNITLRALAAEPARRYPGARDLADDVRRYLNGMPVRARPDSLGYRAAKFVGRHRVGVAAAAIAVAALLVATLVSLSQARIAREQARAARHEAATSQAVKSFLLETFTSADPYRTGGREVTARELLESGAGKIEAALAGQPDVRAELHEAFGDTFAKLDRIEAADAHYHKALEAYGSVGKADSPRALAIEVGLLNTQYEASRLDGLEARLRSLLARIGERTGDVLDTRASALTLLSFTLLTQGRYEAAATAADEVLALGERELGEKHPTTAFSVYTLALVRLAEGRMDEAARLIERFVGVDIETLAPGSPGLVTDLQLISVVLGESGRADAAVPIMQAALAARERHFGAAHRLTASALGRLGWLEGKLGRREAADTHFRQALATMLAQLEEGHDDVASLQYDYAMFLLEGGELDRARELLAASDAVWMRLGGAAHPRHIACAAALARAGAPGVGSNATGGEEVPAPVVPADDAALDRLVAQAQGIIRRAAAAAPQQPPGARGSTE